MIVAGIYLGTMFTVEMYFRKAPVTKSDAVSVNNHELEDHFQYGFDHYEEYQQSMDRLNSMKEMQKEIHTAEEAELAAQMNVKAAQTHALIVRMNLSTETIKENMDSLREDIVHNNYEWISTGFE